MNKEPNFTARFERHVMLFRMGSLMNTPDKIFLIETDDCMSWSEEPAPGDGMEESEAVSYIREDLTYRQSPCRQLCEAKAFEITIRELKSSLIRAAGSLSLEIGGSELSDASSRNIYSVIQELKRNAQ